MSQTGSVVGKSFQFTPSRKEKIRVLSLGGCISHDSMKLAECFNLKQSEHLWRRPTISLMSRSPARLPYMGEEFPLDMARYWQDDFRKSHIRDIVNSEADVLLFDITRDVFCSLLEVEDFSYVVDPMSFRGLVWNESNLTDDIIRDAIGKNCSKISFADESYFEVWRTYFEDFAALASRFDKVILNKIYFTNKIASERNLIHGDPGYVASVNEFLDKSYIYIQDHHKNIIINTIPRKLLMTGVHVSWNGPTYTHFIPEAVAMYAEGIRKIIFGDSYITGELFIRQAIKRANSFEDLDRDAVDIENKVNQISQDRDNFRDLFVQIESHRDMLISELAAVSEERNRFQDLFIKVEEHRDMLLKELHDLLIEQEKSHLALQQAKVEKNY